jgi:hypothetical protein
MKLRIEIKMDNAAFCDEDGNYQSYELARILRKLADRADELDNLPIMDINGNRCGHAEIVD